MPEPPSGGGAAGVSGGARRPGRPAGHTYLQEEKAGGAFGEGLRRDRKRYHPPEA